MIIDAHAHIFPEVNGLTSSGPTRGSGYGHVSIGGKSIVLLPPYCEKTIFTPEMLIENMDWAGVDKAVLLQGPFYGECNRYVVEAIEQFPNRLAGAAYFDPWISGYSRESFEELVSSSAFKAVKLECSESTGLLGIHTNASLAALEITWLWEELERLGMVLVLDLGEVGSRSYQTTAVRAIAEKHPNLKIVIAHLAQPRPDIETDLEHSKLWHQQISLGLLQNVWFDCAALPAYLPGEEFPYLSAGKYLRLAIELIGPHKVMWGSDLPGILSLASYPQLVKMAWLHTGFLSPSEQNQVLRENASHVYGI